MADVLTEKQAKGMLMAIGFDNASRDFTAALKGFQRGNNLVTPGLAEDGDLGQLTSDALRLSYARLRKGLPTMSEHFSYTEFRCKCGGVFADCQRIWELRAHVRRLEQYRAKINAPVRIVSGCRCRSYNKKVGGAKSSQHMFGAASDIEGLRTLDQKEKFEIFAGLGFKQSNSKVVHVDSRDKGGHNLTGGSPTHPTHWRYAT